MKDELLEAMQSTANLMRGMQFDPRIPSDTKQALIERAEELEALIEKYLED